MADDAGKAVWAILSWKADIKSFIILEAVSLSIKYLVIDYLLS